MTRRLWDGNVKVSNGRKYLLKRKKWGGRGVAFLLCQVSAEQPHLACFESKQGQNSTAIESEEPFSAREPRGKNKAADTGVASTSNVNTNFPKIQLTGSSKRQRDFINHSTANVVTSDAHSLSCFC